MPSSGSSTSSSPYNPASPNSAVPSSAIKLTKAAKNIKKGIQTYKMIKKSKKGKQILKAAGKAAAKSIFNKYYPQTKVSGLDNCIGLF